MVSLVYDADDNRFICYEELLGVKKKEDWDRMYQEILREFRVLDRNSYKNIRISYTICIRDLKESSPEELGFV